eukprot:UN00218
MALASDTNPPNSHNRLTSQLLRAIDNCMDELQKQLNKNPNSRIHNNHFKIEREEKTFDNNNYHRKNNKRSRNKNPSVYMSKRLSFYLRHGAEKAGLKIRNDGYVKISDILNLNEFKQNKATFDVIKNIVDTNDKKRFSMIEENKRWLIRANQGHSIKSIKSKELLNEITMNDIDRFPVVCHGTYLKVWDIVKMQGLKTMSRNHIHFVPSDSVNGRGVISGMRYNC